MGRGSTAEIGATRVAQNGYHYTKVSDHPRANNGWILTHHLTAEKKLGRSLADDEIVQFVDKKFKRDPYNPDGIKIIRKKTSSLRRRLAVIDSKIEDLKAERAYINKQLEGM